MRAAALALLLAACGGGEPAQTPDAGGAGDPDAGGGGGPPYATLSEYHLFQGNGSTQQPADGVVPYEVNAILFSDYAAKHRFIVVPEGEKITWQADAKWVFPTGSMLVKTFSYLDDLRNPGAGERLIETRILLKEASGWTPHTYLWNDEQTEAFEAVAGARVPVEWLDTDGVSQSLEYRVPNVNQCNGCHGQGDKLNVLGLRTRQVNRDHDYGDGMENQIEHLEALDLFDAPLPAEDQWQALADPFGDGPVEKRARAYLEANCSHCHNPEGAAALTNLYLLSDVTEPINFGVCRHPTAAGAASGGFQYDVVPGHPEESIMTFRMGSTTPGIKMPEMPIQLVEQPGVDVISAWIASLPGSCP